MRHMCVPGADSASTDESHTHTYIRSGRLVVAAGGSFRFGCQRSPHLGVFEAGGRLLGILATKKKILVYTKYTYKKNPVSCSLYDNKPDIGKKVVSRQTYT